MLELNRIGGRCLGVFDNYEKLFHFIVGREKAKLQKIHPESWRLEWDFQILPPERIANLIHILKRVYDEKMLYEAWHRQVSIVEICEGDWENPHRVLVEGNISIEALREDWCEDYCKAHRLRITKNDFPPLG